MKTPTNQNVQIIKQGGQPIFAVVPYEQWLSLIDAKAEQVTIPHEVVGIQLMDECSLLAAWRKYKNITQARLAQQIGISQAALSQIERIDSRPQEATLEKIATALAIHIDQLRDS